MLERLARLGYASKAVVYLIIGLLAAAAALNMGGRITDQSGALRVILRQPFGLAALIIVAVGLFGYAVWRILDALFDPDHHGTSLNGIAVRITNALKGIIYGTIGIEAVRLIRGLRGSRGRNAELWAARVMHWPLGDWILVATGIIVVGYGIAQIARAIRNQIGKRLDLSPLPPPARRPLVNIARFGVAARAVILVVLGSFLVRAGLQRDPSEVASPRESILELVALFESRLVLALIGAGLIAYAVDQALHALCARIKEPV